jgi:hypothetical protein
MRKYDRREYEIAKLALTRAADIELTRGNDIASRLLRELSLEIGINYTVPETISHPLPAPRFARSIGQ